MKFAELLKKPSAFIPLVMSLAALAIVTVTVAVIGVPHDTDEGSVAHIFQILVAAQLPIVAFFAIKWAPRSPSSALRVLALQAAAVGAAIAPVLLLHL
jgi:FtsH-binding integral membrane protein